MKATGVIRRLDDLGKVVIPKELRRNLNIENGDPVEFFTDNDQVIIRKYQPGYQFCGSMDDLITMKNITICRKCREQIAAELEITNAKCGAKK